MNLTIKDLPPKLHRKLKVRAEENRRSLNWEVIHILEKELDPQPFDMEAMLAEVERVRAKLKVPPMMEEFLREAKNQGRP